MGDEDKSYFLTSTMGEGDYKLLGFAWDFISYVYAR